MRLNSFELAEEVPDEMPPFVHLLVDGEGLCAARMLGDDDLGAARVEFCDNGVAVDALSAIRASKANPSARVEALSRQKHETHDPGAKYLLMAQA
jgi:hypothetical protein